MEQFARFLPNRPIGEDLYDGQSQDRIADAIKAHILAVDAVEDNSTTLPRIIDRDRRNAVLERLPLVAEGTCYSVEFANFLKKLLLSAKT